MFIKTFLVLYQHSTICDIKHGYNRVTSNTSAEYKWQIVVQKIEEIESRIDLEKKTDLYDPKFFYSDNDGALHIIGGYVQMKKENCIQSVFKSNFP